MSFRHIATLLLSIGLAVQSWAARPFFCNTAGRTLEYERVVASTGKVKWTHVMRIGSVKKTQEGESVSYSSEFRKPGGSVMYSGPISLQVEIDGDGNVTMDAGKSVTSVFTNYLSNLKVSSEGGMTVLPADMKPGDSLPDVHCVSKASRLTFRVDITNRKVLRNETISTDAGVFDCVVISEHKVEKGMGRNRTTTALTWYSRGYGMIRHDTYDSGMVLETSEVLKNVN